MHPPTRDSEPESSLRILILVDGLGATGGDRWLYRLSESWIEQGCSVALMHLSGAVETARIRPPAGIAVAAGATDGRRVVTSLPFVLLRLWRAMAHADVAVVSAMGLSLIFGHVFGRLTRTKIVAYSQGLADESLLLYEPRRYLRPLCRWSLRRIDAVMCVSPKSMLAARGLGVPSERVHEVRTGIDVEAVKARSGEAVVVPRDLPTVVAAGTLEARKNFRRIILAVAALRDRGFPARLCVIGPDGGEGRALQRLANDLGLGDAIEFTGYSSNPVPLIAGADVFVHAATSEIVGLVLLEALTVGTPVIAHDCAAGGPRLALDGGRYGRLVDADHGDDLEAALVEHLTNPALLRNKAQGASVYIREEFSVEAATLSSMRLFLALCGSSAR